jgi:co-chaperonin GroES (HSP10)
MSDFDYELTAGQTVNPLPDVILVTNMEHGERVLASGLIIPDDNGKNSGIKPRWATVWRVGSAVDDVKPGDKILVAHGRWTRGVKVKESDGSFSVVRRVDPKDILLVNDSHS